jgi:hypothetical protein
MRKELSELGERWKEMQERMGHLRIAANMNIGYTSNNNSQTCLQWQPTDHTLLRLECLGRPSSSSETRWLSCCGLNLSFHRCINFSFLPCEASGDELLNSTPRFISEDVAYGSMDPPAVNWT